MPNSHELNASARARWLAELAEALEHALRLSLALTARGIESDEALVLRVRILALRAEVGALRRGRRRERRFER